MKLNLFTVQVKKEHVIQVCLLCMILVINVFFNNIFEFGSSKQNLEFELFSVLLFALYSGSIK